jgi:hypothetical protein
MMQRLISVVLVLALVGAVMVFYGATIGYVIDLVALDSEREEVVLVLGKEVISVAKGHPAAECLNNNTPLPKIKLHKDFWGALFMGHQARWMSPAESACVRGTGVVRSPQSGS